MDDKCPICFEPLKNKEKASPNVCNHEFCLSCLEKWSKFGSFCPVDRKRYTKVIHHYSDDVIQVRPRKRKKPRVVYDVSTYCEVCNLSDSTSTLLLCDCCDLAYHCECLNPPLQSVPPGLWYCPGCVAVEEKLRKNKGITKEKGESPQKAKQETENYSKGKELMKQKTFKSELDKGQVEKEKSNGPVVMLEKINIQDFLPSASACCSSSIIKNTSDNFPFQNNVDKSQINISTDINMNATSEIAALNETPSDKSKAFDWEICLNSKICANKINFGECLPSTSTAKDYKNKLTNSCNVSSDESIPPDNEMFIYSNACSDESNGINEYVHSSACSLQKAVDNKCKNSSFEMKSASNEANWEKSTSVHKYMILDDNSPIKSKNMQFSVFEKLDDSIISKEKYSTLKTTSLRTYYSKTAAKCDNLCTCLKKSRKDKKREKLKMWRMNKLLCKKFSFSSHLNTKKSSDRLKFYKCKNKGGYSLKYSTLMYELKKIEKQKWKLQKSQLKTYVMESSVRTMGDSGAKCATTKRKKGITRNNINGKYIAQVSYMVQKTPIYSKCITEVQNDPNTEFYNDKDKNIVECSGNCNISSSQTRNVNREKYRSSVLNLFDNPKNTFLCNKMLQSTVNNSFQNICGSDPNSDSQSFYQNDLKHLVIRSDGSLFLNSPIDKS